MGFLSLHKLWWPYSCLLFCIITARSTTYRSLFQTFLRRYYFDVIVPQCLPKPGVRERIFMEGFLKELQVIHPSRLGIQTERTREAKKITKLDEGKYVTCVMLEVTCRFRDSYSCTEHSCRLIPAS